MNYDEWCNNLLTCKNCKLHQTRTQVVVGAGNPSADILFVGEAPGKDEDLQGIPFVGRSGKRLRKYLKIAGFKPDDYYITNIVKCRPPNNRDPEKDELNTCGLHLIEQIKKYIEPKIIVGIGRISSRIMCKDYITSDHGKLIRFPNYDFFGIYHPAATLYNSNLLDDFQKDLELIYKYYQKCLTKEK